MHHHRLRSKQRLIPISSSSIVVEAFACQTCAFPTAPATALLHWQQLPAASTVSINHCNPRQNSKLCRNLNLSNHPTIPNLLALNHQTEFCLHLRPTSSCAEQGKKKRKKKKRRKINYLHAPSTETHNQSSLTLPEILEGQPHNP